MIISFKKVLLSMIALLLLVVQTTMNADIHEKFKTDEDSPEVLLRKATGAFDLQMNTVSNIQFYTTNYGIFGYNVANRTGGSHWPRNSLNQYIYAGGAWIGAKVQAVDQSTGEKIFNPETGEPELLKLCELTYNPSDGQSWMVPGRIRDVAGSETFLVDNDATAVEKYRTYFSTDFLGNGEPRDVTDGTSWPIWDSSDDPDDTLKTKRYFGYYIEDESLRSENTYQKGPAFISGEDIFATYKDTDLRYFEGGYSSAQKKGYPFYIQYEQMIYSWGFGDYKDFVFIKYDLISFNEDTLRDCWLAPVMDVDIAREPNTSAGAVNDRVRYYSEDSTLNMAVQWSQADRGEAGRGFGYLGYDFLESPAVQGKFLPDSSLNPLEGFLRTDKRKYTNAEQLGLQTFNNWNIADDLENDVERYDFLSTFARDGDEGAGDKRFMMATGPFNMKPYDTARVVVGIIIADAVKDLAAPDGTLEDMATLVTKDKFAQTVYDNNFRAPMPPRRANLSARGVNNGVVLSWDNYSEMSEDNEENGLDFMGYRLYRSRRTDIANYTEHQTDTSGPLGWRQIAEWSMPTAFQKSYLKAGKPAEEYKMPFIDSLMVIGPVANSIYGEVDVLDSFNIRVMRVCQGCIMERQNFFNRKFYDNDGNESRFDTLNLPMIVDIDTAEITTGPWGKYFYGVANKSKLGVNLNKYRYEAAQPYDGGNLEKIRENRKEYLERGYRFNPQQNDFLLDSILIGTIELESAVLDYNPIYYIRKTTKINASTYLGFSNFVATPADQRPADTKDIDTLKWTYFEDVDAETGEVIYVKHNVDTIFYYSTATKIKEAGSDKYVIDYALIDNSAQAIMSNAEHLDYVNKLVYQYLKEGKAKAIFPNFEEKTTYEVPATDSVTGDIAIDPDTGEVIYDTITVIDRVDFQQSKLIREGLIPEYMEKLTDGRTFVDLGDNGDGIFYYDEDPTKSERMINNVDYYYKLLSFDEGDYQQPTEIKENDASLALPNALAVRPKAAAITNDVKFDIEVVNPERMGGVYNFEFFPIDEQRVSQFFAGHVFELEFKPYWSLGSYTFTGREEPAYFGKYVRMMTLKDTVTKQILYEGITEFEEDPGDFAYLGAFTENGLSYVLADTLIQDPVSNKDINFAAHDSREVRERFGSWSTGEMVEGLYTPYIGTGYRTSPDAGGVIYASGMKKPAYGAFGFKFEFDIKQYGGDYRMDTVRLAEGKTVDMLIPRYTDTKRKTLNIADKLESNDDYSKSTANTITTQKIGSIANYKYATIPTQKDLSRINATYPQVVTTDIMASYNNGPGTYELEFTGKEKRHIKVWYQPSKSEDVMKEFDVDVLTVKVRNVTKYDRRDGKGGFTEVSYESDMEHINIPAKPYNSAGYSTFAPYNNIGQSPYWISTGSANYLYTKAFPYPVNTVTEGIHPDELYNTYNMFASGWIDVRETKLNALQKPKHLVYRVLDNGEFYNEDGKKEIYSGIQGGFALPATAADGTTIDFVNVIYIAGVPFFFDGANAGSNTLGDGWDQVDIKEFNYGGQNFQVGDKITLSTTGGALGLPAPGAKVRVKVGGTVKSPDQMSDEDLDAVKVVPNPYFISHQGQKSPYGAELYFTRLPEECTIDIYTVTGEIVTRIEHNELTSPDSDKVAVDIWDLLSDNNQRVASQALVAVITTPNGAQTVKNFSVVVGSYRIITD